MHPLCSFAVLTSKLLRSSARNHILPQEILTGLFLYRKRDFFLHFGLVTKDIITFGNSVKDLAHLVSVRILLY